MIRWQVFLAVTTAGCVGNRSCRPRLAGLRSARDTWLHSTLSVQNWLSSLADRLVELRSLVLLVVRRAVQRLFRQDRRLLESFKMRC